MTSTWIAKSPSCTDNNRNGPHVCERNEWIIMSLTLDVFDELNFANQKKLICWSTNLKELLSIHPIYAGAASQNTREGLLAMWEQLVFPPLRRKLHQIHQELSKGRLHTKIQKRKVASLHWQAQAPHTQPEDRSQWLKVKLRKPMRQYHMSLQLKERKCIRNLSFRNQ